VELRRVAFSPADVEALAAFSLANDGWFDAPLVRRLLVDLTSHPSGVIVLADGDATVLVATVVDGAENAAAAAHLEVLGVAEGARLSRAAFAELVVAPAVAFARAGVRRALMVPLHPSFARVVDAEAVLRAAGFEPSYASYTMCRRGDLGPPDGGALLPPGWRWDELDDARVDGAHALLADAFRGAPSFSLSAPPLFRRAVAARTTTWRALLDGDTLAGLAQVAAYGARAELRTIARAPAYRGRGVGERLVGEALRVLLIAGPRDVELSVEADNERALALYRGFGFETVARTPVLGLALRR
jgi:ribosomal protein S18 acetylase RimI-like enzyme